MTVSLRDFKKGIQDLKEELAHLTKGSEEYNRVAKEIRDAQGQLKSQMEGTKDVYAGMEGSYNALVRQMAELKKEWRATNDEARRNELGAQIGEINQKLKDFDSSIGNHQRNVGDYEIATKSLRQELKDLTQQIAQGLASGLKTTDPEIKALTKRAGELKDAMADANAMINVAASDVGGFVQALDLAKTAMAGFTAAQGLAQLFGDENGEMQELVKTMRQMQALQTTLNGLQQLQTSLVDRGSATYRLYHKVLALIIPQKKAEAAATDADNKAKQIEATTTKASTTATNLDTTAKAANTTATLTLSGALKVLRAALISTGIGVLVVALGAVLANITDITKAIGKLFGWLGKVTGVTEAIKNVAGWVSDNVDAFKKWAHITEEKTAADIALENAEKALKKASEEYYETLGKERVELQANIARLKDFKGNKEDEKRIVDELNSKYGNTLGTYKNINDWQKKLVTDGEKYLKYLYEEAKATALAQKAAEVFADWKINNVKRSSQENLEAKRLFDETEKLALEQASKANTLGASLYGGDNAKEAKKQRQTAKKQQQDLLKDLKDYTDETIKLINHRYKMEELNDKLAKESELKRINDIYNIQSQYYDAAEARLNKALKNVKEGSEEWKKINDAILSNDKARADAELKYEEDVAAAKKKIREDEKKEQEKAAKENANKLRKEYDADINALNREQTQMLNDVDPVRDKNNIKATEAYQQQVFDIEKAFTLKRIELLNQMAEALKDQPEAYEAVIARIIEEQDKLTEAERQRNEESKNNAIEANNQKLQSWMELSNSLSSLMGGIIDFYQQQIDEDVKAGKITEKEAKKRFEQVKKAQIATAIISTISGAVGAYKNAIDAYPAPFDIAIGIANAATVLASGYAQIAKIKSTQYGSNGGNGSSGGIMSAKVAPLIDTQDVANIQTPNVNATVTNPEDQRVYVVESDIANAGRKVQVRESETKF